MVQQAAAGSWSDSVSANCVIAGEQLAGPMRPLERLVAAWRFWLGLGAWCSAGTAVPFGAGGLGRLISIDGLVGVLGSCGGSWQ